MLMPLLDCFLRLYGVMCLQVAIYFRTYPGDRLLLKATVRLSLGAYVGKLKPSFTGASHIVRSCYLRVYSFH